MELKGKKVLVVGLARTGAATARFLARQGVRLKISEAKPAKEVEAARKALQNLPVEWELGGHTIQFFGEVDLIVVSPGVPMDIEPLMQARAKGIQVISEMELAFQFLRRPLIGITGSNGKT
ncbi:MAG: UDP-N-acetylmuramoyl-L-alanine--D-glutamate ligase, partial [Deltaproteobacteria bacterium]|nr:UDP-N-acetylmuramoyl-L-alanine--D-glutamate ligase [Deltaproteobacteria bacterium]